jgi:hypothetical protein
MEWLIDGKFYSWYVPPYYMSNNSGAHPELPESLACSRHVTSHFTHPPPSAFALSFRLVMLTPEIPCPGCERRFSPRGLSQHISKSRDARCRAIGGTGAPDASQVPVVSFPDLVSQRPPDPFSLSDTGHLDMGLEPQSTIGKFFVTCGAHLMLKKVQR